MKATKPTTLLLALIILVVLGTTAYFTVPAFQYSITTGANYKIKAPTTINPGQTCTHLVGEVYGTIRCEKVENKEIQTGLVSFAPVTTGQCTEWFKDAGNNSYYIYPWCPSWAGSKGCSATIESVKCNPNWGGIFTGNQLVPIVRFSNGNWQKYSSSVVKQTLGSFDSAVPIRTEIACAESNVPVLKPSCATGYPISFVPTLRVNAQVFSNYLYSEGKVPQGKLEGSEPQCSIVTASSQLLKKLQPKNDARVDNIQGIEFLKSGDTKSVVVGWEEQIIPGNVVKYQGKDVVCVKTFNRQGGLYDLKKVSLFNGKQYCKKNSIILTETDDFCCQPDQCSKGTACENFRCVTKNIICDQGEETCDKYYTAPAKTEIWDKKTNKFYLQSKKCNIKSGAEQGCTKTTKEEVKCTLKYCNTFDTFDPNGKIVKDYYCPSDYSGCLLLPSGKEDCKKGQCCKEGHSLYNVQPCLNNQKCCIAEVNDDPLVGVCKTKCDPNVKVEDCTNGIDDDGDGLIDEKDPDCMVCVIDETNYKYTPKQCCEAKGDTWLIKKDILGRVVDTECLHCNFMEKFTKKECGGGILGTTLFISMATLAALIIIALMITIGVVVSKKKR